MADALRNLQTLQRLELRLRRRQAARINAWQKDKNMMKSTCRDTLAPALRRHQSAITDLLRHAGS